MTLFDRPFFRPERSLLFEKEGRAGPLNERVEREAKCKDFGKLS